MPFKKPQSRWLKKRGGGTGDLSISNTSTAQSLLQKKDQNALSRLRKKQDKACRLQKSPLPNEKAEKDRGKKKRLWISALRLAKKPPLLLHSQGTGGHSATILVPEKKEKQKKGPGVVEI